MLFVLRPTAQATSSRPVYFDPEEAFLEFKRREYISALEEQQQRSQFERELALEQERHRRALANIKAQEAVRRRQQAYSSYSPYSPYGAQLAHSAQAQASKAQAGCGSGLGGARFCHQPAPEEILRRRVARQQEEERLSRQFHEHILSQIFGIPTETSEESAASGEAGVQPKASTSAKGKGKETATASPAAAAAPKRTRFEDEATEPHWSAAPERAQSLAEISSINRNFISLRNTFTFPTGHLEGVKGSDVPRLAYNEVNATIHAYDHALSELLTRLDGVDSHGFKGVREARKQLVVKIEKELEQLEKKIAERLAGDASPAAPFVSIPVEGSSAPSSPITSTAASTSTVVPAAPISPILAPAPVMASNDNDIVMDEPQPSAPAAEKAALGGYDIEFEDDYEAAAGVGEESKDALVAEPVIEQSNEQVPIEVDQDAQEPEQPVEPTTETALATTPAPIPVEVPTSTPTSASPVTQTTVHTAVLAEAEPVSTSDEESEIEDAVHIEISSDEENVHAASDKDDQHSDEDGAFEML